MSKLNETDMTNTDLQKHRKAKEFVKQVWNVNHQGQPLPTDQNENVDSDIIIAQVRFTTPTIFYGNFILILIKFIKYI